MERYIYKSSLHIEIYGSNQKIMSARESTCLNGEGDHELFLFMI